MLWLSTLIFYKNGKFCIVRGVNFYKYSDKLHYKHYSKKGKAIYDIYKQMNEINSDDSDDEMEVIREILHMSSEVGFQTPIPKGEIYEALEIADRLDMTIEFFPNEETTNRCDGWEYFIRIIPGKLPQRI